MSQPPDNDQTRVPSVDRSGSTTPESLRTDRHRQDSSGDSSAQSGVVTGDRWRFGGPGPLPEWPLSEEEPSPSETPPDLMEAATAITGQHIENHGLNCFISRVSKRFSTGATPSSIDTTIVIQSVTTPDAGHRSMLAGLLPALAGIGWPGRVEVVDHRALSMKNFAARLSDQAQQEWPKIDRHIIERLDSHELPWVMIFVVNRGYWDEISVPTVIAKIQAPIKSSTWSRVIKSASAEIGRYLVDYQLELLMTGDEGIWGPFVSPSGPSGSVFDRTSPLGWPFTRGFNTTGMSVGCEGVPGSNGTLGGYFEYQDSNAKMKRFIGITCYHIIRRGPKGYIDQNVERNGGLLLRHPCQSPSADDMQAIKAEVSGVISAAISPQIHSAIAAKLRRDQQEATQKKAEIDAYKKHIGTVLAASGWRNIALQPQSFLSTDMLVDWACIEISKQAHWPQSINYIEDIPGQLQRQGSLAAAHWACSDQIITRAATMPSTGTVLFKRGRSSGLTAGKLGSLSPATFRLPDLPASVHHRGYVVTSDFGTQFASPGDSGSWCLNGDGQLVGMIFAGDTAQQIGLMTPIEVVARDIERVLQLPTNSLDFPK